MNTETYELLAHGASYWFVILAAIMVIKGIRNSREDNRKERDLRAWSGDSGCVGELVVLADGVRSSKKSIRGARFLVPAEGLIGSGGVADIRIKHPDVARKHIWFTYEPGGLYIKLSGRAKAECPTDPDGRMVLRDDDRLIIGKLEMVMVFFSVQDAAVSELQSKRRTRTERKKNMDEYDDPFEESFWE